MIKKDKYWVLRPEEFDMMVGLLKDTKEFQDFQKGAAINNLLLSADKALTEYKETQQPAPAPHHEVQRTPKKPIPKREVIEPEPEEEPQGEEEGEPGDMDELTDEDF